jgi:hypothetical protein
MAEQLLAISYRTSLMPSRRKSVTTSHNGDPPRKPGYGGETGRDTSWSGPSSGTYTPAGVPQHLDKPEIHSRTRKKPATPVKNPRSKS